MIEIFVNGRAVQVPERVSAAAALFIAGETRFRTSVSGEPRAALCGMGVCFECRATVDGREHERTCQVFVRPGIRIDT